MARTTANVDRPTAVIWVRGPAPTRQRERELIARTIQQLYHVRAIILDDWVRGAEQRWCYMTGDAVRGRMAELMEMNARKLAADEAVVRLAA